MEALHYLKFYGVILPKAEKIKVLKAMEDYKNQRSLLIETETIWELFIGKWNKTKRERGLKGAIRVLGFKEKNQITQLIKAGYTTDQIMQAYVNAINNNYHRETNYRYLTPEFITRPDKFNRFINEENKPANETGDYAYQ